MNTFNKSVLFLGATALIGLLGCSNKMTSSKLSLASDAPPSFLGSSFNSPNASRGGGSSTTNISSGGGCTPSEGHSCTTTTTQEQPTTTTTRIHPKPKPPEERKPLPCIPTTSTNGRTHCDGGADPLVLDLSGSGFAISTVANGVNNFDLLANGEYQQVAWMVQGRTADQALLFVDRDGDGVVTNGSELFGYANPDVASRYPSSAKPGFDALAEFDSNHDGVIDARDKYFNRIMIWIDRNRDGISTPDEVYALADFVESISLNAPLLDSRDPRNWSSDQRSFLSAFSFARLKNGKFVKVGDWFFGISE